MKTNLSSCCNAEALEESSGGTTWFYKCTKCQRACDLASPEVVEWEDEYPLNTFTGETKKELIAFIKTLLSTQEKDLREKISNIIHKRAKKHHKDCLTDMFINGRFWEDKDILELINKDK